MGVIGGAQESPGGKCDGWLAGVFTVLRLPGCINAHTYMHIHGDRMSIRSDGSLALCFV